MITQEIHLKTATYGIPPVVHMVQGDSGRELSMILDDMELDASHDAVLAIHRPDDSYYEQDATVVFVSNSVTAPAYQAITRPGKVECQLKISDSDELLSTFDFIIMVHESADGLPVEQLGYNIYDLIDAAQTLQPTLTATDDGAGNVTLFIS